MAPVDLENSYLKAAFDSASGGLAGLLNKKTGQQWVQPGSSPELFRLILPTKQWRGHHIDSSGQRVKLTRSENEIRGAYQGLVSPEDSSDIGLLNTGPEPLEEETSLDSERLGLKNCDIIEIYGVDGKRSAAFNAKLTVKLESHEMRIVVLRRQKTWIGLRMPLHAILSKG